MQDSLYSTQLEEAGQLWRDEKKKNESTITLSPQSREMKRHKKVDHFRSSVRQDVLN